HSTRYLDRAAVHGPRLRRVIWIGSARRHARCRVDDASRRAILAASCGGESCDRTRAARRRAPDPPASLAAADDGLPVIALPHSLTSLLEAQSAADADAAWRAFVAEHSRIVLHVCRSVWHSHDDAMD